MSGYVLRLGGAAILLLVAGVIAFVLFGSIWVRVGIVAAIVVVCGPLLLFAWNVDRKERARRAGVDELPRA